MGHAILEGCHSGAQQSQNYLVRIHTDMEGTPYFLCVTVFKHFSCKKTTIYTWKRHSSAAKTSPSQFTFRAGAWTPPKASGQLQVFWGTLAQQRNIPLKHQD